MMLEINPGPGLGQTQKYGRVKQVNGIHEFIGVNGIKKKGLKIHLYKDLCLDKF